MARLRAQIPAVTEALRKTQQRYKENFDTNVATRNRTVKIGDYVYMTNHDRENKLQSKATGPYLVVDADASTYVIDIAGEEKRISSDHATPAPRPTLADATPHPLLDGLDKPKDANPVVDEYVVDRLLGVKKLNGQYLAKVRWFDYGPKDDSWEPLDALPRYVVVRYLRQKKLTVPGYGWTAKSPTAKRKPRGATASATATTATVSLVTSVPEWIPKIIHVYTSYHGVIQAVLNWTQDGQAFLVEETVPLSLMKLTLPQEARNLQHDPLWGLYYMTSLSRQYGPYTAVWPPPLPPLSTKATDGQPRAPNLFMCPVTDDLDQVLLDILAHDHEVTLIAPMWTHTTWYQHAMSACFEYQVLLPVGAPDGILPMTIGRATWALVAFHFLNRYEPTRV